MLCAILFVGSLSPLLAQGEYVFGLLPEAQVSRSLPNEWKVVGNVESRQALRRGRFDDNPGLDYDYLLTDVSFAFTKGIFFRRAWSLGYLLRLRDAAPAHRLFQQFVIDERYVGYRVSYRLATDQTFSSADPTEYRLRLRAAGELPLRGLAVDDGEHYLKASHEYLNKWAAGQYDLETRLVAALGRQIANGHNLEIGFDYRLDNFLNGAPAHSFWTTVGWYRSF